MTPQDATRNALNAAFVEAMTAMLHRVGATPNPTGWYALRLHTLAGRLEISVLDGWVAARFIEPDRAKALLSTDGDLGSSRLNPFSGKWNFHFGRWDRIEDAVELVEAELRAVVGALPSG